MNNKSYVGKSFGDRFPYMGSGILLWKSYIKYFNNKELNSNHRRCHKWVYEHNKELKIYDFRILCYCDTEEELNEMETKIIYELNTISPYGYNISSGGDGGNLIKGYSEQEKKMIYKKISENTKKSMERPDVRERLLESVCNKNDEWRANISKSLTGKKGRKMSDETKGKLRKINIGNKYGVGNKSNTGKHLSKETRDKISASSKKIKHTEEWNKKVSNSLKGKSKSIEHRKALSVPKKKYKWLTPNGDIIEMDAGNAGKHKDWIKIC